METVNFAFMKIFDFLVKIIIFRAFLLFWGDSCHAFCPDQVFDCGCNAWRKSQKKRRNAQKMTILTKKSKIFITAKLTVLKSFLSKSAVAFLIWCILEHGQRHLVDFWEKFPTDLDFIWIEKISYNSGVLFQIVWSSTSTFKLKSSSTEGCHLWWT